MITMELLLEGFPIYSLMLLVILIILYLYCCYKLNYWKRRGFQQLGNTNKIFGNFKNAFLFRTAPGYHFGNIYREAPPDAPYIGFYIFHKPCLLLRDLKIIKQILIGDFSNFSDRSFAGSQQTDSIGMITLFGLNNPAWRYLRKKIIPTLNGGKLKQMLPLMMETGKPMMDYLRSNIDNKNGAKVIDAQEINYKYAADLIANVALGTNTDSFHHPHNKYTKRLMDFFHSFKRMVALVIVFFVPELVTVIGSRMLFDSTFVRKIFWNAFESRVKSGQSRGDFIDSVIQLKNGEQNSILKFEGDNLLYQSGLFFSGFESSSTVSAFTIMELARNKGYQQRVRHEIKSALDKHGWTYDAFREMKYLDLCISESARLHPPVSTIDRYTLSDYKIPNTDLIIEKGTSIYISLYGLHGDPKFFEEPDVFNPERFEGDSIKSDAYLAFGVGPRDCIGAKIGRLHVKLVLCLILSEYEVYQKSTEVLRLDSRSTITSAADGIHIEFTKLTHSST